MVNTKLKPRRKAVQISVIVSHKLLWLLVLVLASKLFACAVMCGMLLVLHFNNFGESALPLFGSGKASFFFFFFLRKERLLQHPYLCKSR